MVPCGDDAPGDKAGRVSRGQASLNTLAGERPIGTTTGFCYLAGMNLILVIVLLLLIFGGGGFYIGGPAIGGGGLGLILIICLIVYLMGGFRNRN